MWAGRWAEGLGLAGVVEADELRALVEGKHPVTGVDLLAGSRPRSVLAFDLTFSAPKSVSLLWALRFGAGGRGGGGRSPGGGGGGVGVPGGARRAGPGPIAGGPSSGGDRGLGGGGVRPPHEPGGRSSAAHALSGAEPGAAGRRRPPCGIRCGPVVRVGPGGRVGLPEPAAARPCRSGWGWLGAGPSQHPGDGGFHPRPSCGRSPSAAPRSRPSWRPRGAMYESPALRMQADDEASLATRTAKDHSLTPRLLAGRWQREAEQVGLAVGADLDRAVCRADRPVGAAGLGGDHRRPGRPGGRVVLPVGPLHQGGRGRAHLRHLGRPAVGRRRSPPWPSGSSTRSWRCA